MSAPSFGRTCYAGDVSAQHLDQTVTLFGWVQRRRDHGGVIFIDLRDREGIVQVVCDPDRESVFATAERIRNEFCLRMTGRVRGRPEGTINPNLGSGEVVRPDDEITSRASHHTRIRRASGGNVQL